MTARKVENDDRDFEFKRGEGPCVVRNPDGLHGDIRRALNACVRRHEIVFALELKPVAAQIKEGDVIGSQCAGFVEKISKRSPQRVVVEVARADDLKACSFQRLCDQTCVVGRSLKRSSFIGCIAQDQRDPLFRARAAWSSSDREYD